MIRLALLLLICPLYEVRSILFTTEDLGTHRHYVILDDRGHALTPVTWQPAGVLNYAETVKIWNVLGQDATSRTGLKPYDFGKPGSLNEPGLVTVLEPRLPPAEWAAVLAEMRASED